MRKKKRIDIRCWWCDADINGIEKQHSKTCPSAKLSKEAMQIGIAMFHAEWCDHFCCGMPAKVCRAKALEFHLKSVGWKSPKKKVAP